METCHEVIKSKDGEQAIAAEQAEPVIHSSVSGAYVVPQTKRTRCQAHRWFQTSADRLRDV